MITHAPFITRARLRAHRLLRRVDAAGAPDLQRACSRAADPGRGAAGFDLGGCSFIDSLGIAAVVAGTRAMLDTGRSAAIACDHPSVRRSLALTGLDELVEIYWTREEAVSALAGEPR